MLESLFNFSQNFSKDFYKAVDNTVIISITDLDGTIKYVSSEFCRISGFTHNELIGNKHSIIRHRDTLDRIIKNIWETIKGGNIRRGMIKNKKKNGEYFWVKTVIIPIKDDNGEIIEYMSIRNEVTKLIDTISELNDYKNALNFSAYFIKLDKVGLVKFVNNKFANAMGIEEKNLIGRPLLEEISYESTYYTTKTLIDNLSSEVLGVSIDSDNKEIINILHDHKPWKGIVRLKTNYNSFIWIDTSIFPIFDLDNKIKEYIIIADDVSDLEISKHKLKRSLHKLKELDDKKSEFMNIASHELRTPMTAIRGYLSMILDGDFGEINDDVAMYIKKTLNNSQKLLDMINDMLDLSRLESSRQNFNLSEFDINDLVEDISNDLKPLLLNKKHTLIFERLDSELIIETDMQKLKNAIVNVLGNAIKYTPEGGIIEIIVEKNSYDFSIDVIDNGIGISKDDQKIIFEKFGQVKNSLTRDINGTGLGLPIVKATVERLGGKILLESEENKGSKFTIQLPLKFI